MARCESCIHSGMCKMEIAPNWNRENCPWCKPTADVVPKSEVAREIFAKIDILIDDWKHSRIQSIQFIAELAELKKKYTESNTND